MIEALKTLFDQDMREFNVETKIPNRFERRHPRKNYDETRYKREKKGSKPWL